MKQISITIEDVRNFAESLPLFSAMTNDELEYVYSDIGAMGAESDASEGQLLALDIEMTVRGLIDHAYDYVIISMINEFGHMVDIRIDADGINAVENYGEGWGSCEIPTSGTLIHAARGVSYVDNWEYAPEAED